MLKRSLFVSIKKQVLSCSILLGSAQLLFAWLCLQDFKRLFPYLFVTMKNIKQQTLSNFLFASRFCRGKKYWEFILKKEFMGVELQIAPMRTYDPRTYTKRVSRNFILIVLHDHVVTGKKSNHIFQLLVFFNVYIISY